MKSATIFAGLVLSSVAAFAEPHAIGFEDMLALKRVGAACVSPDGRSIAFDVTAPDLALNRSSSAVFIAPIAGGAPIQISEGSLSNGPAWSPDGRAVAFVSNRDGGAQQIWLYDVATARSRPVSNLAAGAGSVKWTPDGSALLAVSDIYPDCGVDPTCTKDKSAAEEAAPTKAHLVTSLMYRHWKSWTPATRTHVVLQPIDGRPARDLTPGAFDAPPFSLGGGDEFDISPDGREVVFARDTATHPETSTNSDLFLVPATGGEPRRITTREGADTSPHYSPDGKWIAYRSQARAGYESDLFELWLYDRSNGQSHRIATDFPNWVDSVAWTPDSRHLLVTAPEEGREAIEEVSLDGHTTTIYREGTSDAVTTTRDGATIVFQWSSLTHPAEIYAMTRGGKPHQLTHANDAELAGLRIGATRDLHWTGADNANVQGFVVTPPDFDPARRYPAIVLIHGGPQGAWEDGWGYRWNPEIFASRGYVVLLPNPRGSTGFGQKFVEEVSGDWGGRAYIDIMNGVDALAALPFVDGNRIGAAGGSYGGYMIDWILGHTDRFKALVSHAGVYDLVSEYGVTEELWFPEWEFHGNPWDNPELYQKWSPNQFVKNFKTPTMVSHGELDYRVPINQGLELFTALQRRGIPSQLLDFPDEGHWVLKPQNSKLWYATVGAWFDRWLK